MKHIVILFISILFTFACNGQKVTLDENTIVKDSSGMQYPYVVWKKLLSTGYYSFKPISKGNPEEGFLLIKLTEEEKDKKDAKATKPSESKFFTTGTEISNFKERDMDGNKWNLRNLRGKVVVMNFWFINCPPCRSEMPELNKVVEKYKNDSSVVFISFCLDESSLVKDFLVTNPFNYKIIDNAKYIAEQYKVTAYPTHVVLDKEGKVQYHTSGLGSGTIPWLKKTIETFKAK